MEILSEIWIWIGSAFGGVSIAAIVSAVIYGCLKGAFNRTISKLNVKKIADEATKQGVEKVKKISFTQSIQPLVESELKKITEEANHYIDKGLAETQAKYDKLIAVIEKLAAYFDNSIGVSDTAKEELKQAIADAKEEPIEKEQEIILESEPVIEKEPEQSIEQPKATKKSKIER